MGDIFDEVAEEKITGKGDIFDQVAAEPWSVTGFGRNLGESAKRFGTGIVKAVSDPVGTVSNVADVAGGGILKGLEAAGIGTPSEREKRAIAKFNAIAGDYKKRYGSPGQALETLYTDPIGAVSDISAIAGGAGAGLKAAGLNRAAKAANVVSQATNPLVAVPRAASAMIPKSARELAARRMYQGALKPPPGTFAEPEVRSMVEVGLREQIPISVGGKALGKTRGKIDAINAEVQKTIASGAAAGDAVHPLDVANYTTRARTKFANQADDLADVQAIDDVTKRFLERKGGVTPETPLGTPIPVDQAQKLKQGTYAKLRESYGELSTAAKEAQKDLARGLKEEVYRIYPQLRELGQKEGALINLEEALERFANRYGNRDVVGLGGPAKVITGVAASGGNPLGALAGAAAAALEMPAVKSRLAIALSKSAQKAAQPARIRQALNAATGLQAPRSIEELGMQ